VYLLIAPIISVIFGSCSVMFQDESGWVELG